MYFVYESLMSTLLSCAIPFFFFFFLSNLQGKRYQEFDKSGVKSQRSLSKGNDFWFEKSGLHCSRSSG